MRVWSLAAVAAAAVVHRGFGADCAIGGAKNALKVDEHTSVCITLNGVRRAAFNPKVDEYSLLQVSNTTEFFPEGTGIIQDGTGFVADPDTTLLDCSNGGILYNTVQVESFNSTSIPLLYRKVDCTQSPATITFYPLATAIIHSTDSGSVDFITWDFGCYFCDSDSADCERNGYDSSTTTILDDGDVKACGITCTAGESCSGCAGGACDLKVYVVWTGEDVDGTYFTSSNLRFSRFRSFGASSLYDSALGTIDQGINEAQGLAGDVQNLPGQVGV